MTTQHEQIAEAQSSRTTNPELLLGESWRKDRRYKPRSSSRWLSPPQLVIAGYRQVIAGLFESFADRRDSLETRPNVVLAHPDVDVARPAKANGERPTVRPLFPDGKPKGDSDGFWFDYVADLGDGFNATYSVAEEIALTNEPSRTKRYEADDGSAHVLSRGELLVMGGDEVYPLASETEYRNRTVGPYETACRHKDPGMALLAVPGNHDWYDGLTAFLSRFCSEQWIGGWHTRQTRSYWAAKVQPGWWIWGVDLALEHTPIDYHQLAYFRSVAASLMPEDRIILVTPKPAWLQDRKAWVGGGSPSDEPYNPSYDQLSFFMNTTIEAWMEHLREAHTHDSREPNPDLFTEDVKPQFAMVVAGDKHTYCRYDNDTQVAETTAGSGAATSEPRADVSPESPRRIPHVLSGGGGAYLSLPFHHAKKVRVPQRWRRPETVDLDLKKQWPERSDTNRLAITSLWRIFTRNWGFGMLLGTIYLLFARAINAVDPLITNDPFAPAVTWRFNIERYADAIWDSWPVLLFTIGLVYGLQARSHLGATTRYALAAIQTVIHLVAIAGCDTIARWAADGGGELSGDQWSAMALVASAFAWGAWGVHRWMFNGRAPRHVLLSPALFGFALYVFIAEPNTWSWSIPMLAISTIIGASVFSITLLISAYTFGDKENLVSVTVREVGWKNFLRVHIDGDTCRVWAIGLQRVPHQRLVFRKDGVENYEEVDPETVTEPARFTPEVTPIFGGLLGLRRKGYEAKIIDAWTVHRHPIAPAQQTIDTTSPVVETTSPTAVSA